MKKALLLFFVVAMAAVSAKAQISAGVRAGANMSGYVTEDGKGSARYAPTFGAFAQIKLGPIAIQPELNYSAQGVYGDLNTADIAGEETAKALEAAGMKLFQDSKEFVDKVSYLQVPIMVKFYPIPALKLNVQAGPQFGYALGAKRAYTDEFVADLKQLGVALTEQEGDIENFKSTDMSLNVGAGLEIWKLDLAVRYNIGLSQIDKELSAEELATTNPLFTAPDGKNQNFQFSVGYKLF